MYRFQPPLPAEQIEYSNDPLIDATDRLFALESAFTLLAVALVESGVLQTTALKTGARHIASECDEFRLKQAGGYMDGLAEAVESAVQFRLRKRRREKSGLSPAQQAASEGQPLATVTHLFPVP